MSHQARTMLDSSVVRASISPASAKRMKRADGPVPSRCGNLPWIFAPRLNIKVTVFRSCWTKLARSPLYANWTVPYFRYSPIRVSAHMITSRTRRSSASAGLPSSHLSTYGSRFTT